jgi:indolepyruvate ferredoxin oxidoreductase
MGLLARMRRLRGTAADIFGYTAERRAERSLIEEFFTDVDTVCAAMTPANHPRAVEFARLAEEIRGFGPVKAAAMDSHAARRSQLLDKLKPGGAAPILPPVHRAA